MIFTNLDFEKNKDITSSTINLEVCAKKLGKIEFVDTAQTIDDAYPAINNVGNQTFLLQTDDNIYTLSVVINYISQRLYYHIVDQNNAYIIRFAPLAVWPFNLLSHNTFKDYYLFFQNGTLYFGKLSDYEASVNQAVYVGNEALWIDYAKEEEDDSEDFLLPVTGPKEVTELSVTPSTLLMDLGKKSLINVKTNAEVWSWEFKGPSLASVDEQGIITATESGYTLLKITAQKEGCLASQASVSLYISTKGQISQQDKEEIVESLKPATKREAEINKLTN